MPSDHLPLIGQNRIEPGVIRLVTDRVVVQIRHGLVQIMKDLSFPIDESPEYVLGEFQCHGHRVAIVVMRHVFAPINEVRPVLSGMREMPVVNVDLPVAAIDFDDGSDKRDQSIANRLDPGTLIYSQTVSEFHQSRGSARLGSVDGSGDVVNGNGCGDKTLGFSVVHLDQPRIREPRKAASILLEIGDEFLRRYGNGDHFTAFFRRTDRDHLHAARGPFEHPHVAVNVGGVRQLVRSACNVAEHSLWRRYGGRGGKVVRPRRIEKRFRRIFPDLFRVLFVDCLLRVSYPDLCNHELRRHYRRGCKQNHSAEDLPHGCCLLNCWNSSDIC